MGSFLPIAIGMGSQHARRELKQTMSNLRICGYCYYLFVVQYVLSFLIWFFKDFIHSFIIVFALPIYDIFIQYVLKVIAISFN